MSDNIVLTKEDLEKLATKIVADTLVRLGIEPEDHKDMQQDMIFLRKLRKLNDTMSTKHIMVLTGFVLTAIGTFVVLGFKTWITTFFSNGP